GFQLIYLLLCAVPLSYYFRLMRSCISLSQLLRVRSCFVFFFASFLIVRSSNIEQPTRICESLLVDNSFFNFQSRRDRTTLKWVGNRQVLFACFTYININVFPFRGSTYRSI